MLFLKMFAKDTGCVFVREVSQDKFHKKNLSFRRGFQNFSDFLIYGLFFFSSGGNNPGCACWKNC